MRIVKKILKFLAWFLGILLLLLLIFCVYVWKVSDVKPPAVQDRAVEALQRTQLDSTAYVLGNNWLRKSRYGLYEMYVSGGPFERGVINGKLSRELIVSQEIAFTHQIRKMIPSEGYLKFLKYVVGFMNRGLPEHVTDEYKLEIYGESLAASDSFKWIGSNYARQLNYHAAHDIGHALQNLMLVGCTSFGAWDTKTESGAMILGRNFDFWVGDEFAEHKIVSFVNPTTGHKFAYITWGGFVGVVSGMNDQGLTVTINAARSRIPFDAATPVSLVAREILQYAGNIKEAVAIAHKREMFVSESFLVGSAADHRSALIEKTPDTLAVYDPAADHIECTNHYQSDLLGAQKLNQEQMQGSASVYRYQRLQELLQQQYPLNPAKVAAILRDRKGLHDADIGNGNEKAVNQFIAHHSVIFMPDSLRMWVSTAPWQMGTYVCYDLRKVFAMQGLGTDHEVADTSLNIPPDPFLQTDEYARFLLFRKAKMNWMDKVKVGSGAFVSNNPEYYDAYRLEGDYQASLGNADRAVQYYKMALTKEIATVGERLAIEEKIRKINKAKAGK
ncbi:C45 family autoproteolytic acyltransferase/hydolase [Taibaiella chishuiensis]|uniref:Acyl-CoA:6-aminopenicillanic acid acyl transferase n=1 Tax=Taibaiella chishuiensis TaxID=1434707 RepID=A0A2P8D5Z7_9BACT|nr:C45 family peptidase [Taibaiella chishuiensis]PSK92650.1 acyl-CoA:6-aminopenicillanic acid acyl transferase [Taibaiella chishuiensis]